VIESTRSLAANVRNEFRLAGRRTTTRIGLLLFFLACTVPPLYALCSPSIPRNSGSILGILFSVEPAATTLLAVALSGDAIHREREEGTFAVLALSPVSSMTYVVHRWSACVLALVVTTLAPVAFMGAVSTMAASSPVQWSGLLATWALLVLPVALVVSALALGFGTAAGGTVPGMSIVGLLLFAILGIGNAAWAGTRVRLFGPTDFLGLTQALRTPAILAGELAASPDRLITPRFAFDVLCGRAALLAGIAALSLSLAIGHLGRCVPSLPDRLATGRGHLRRRAFSVIRDKLTADGRLLRADRIARAAGVALGLLCVAVLAERHTRYRQLAKDAYLNLAETWPTTPAAPLSFEGVELRGAVEETGRFDGLVRFRVRNNGTARTNAVTFSINPGLQVLGAKLDSGDAYWDRRWNRLLVELDPSVEPGGYRVLTLSLAGLPERVAFVLTPRNLGPEERRLRTFFETAYYFQLGDITRSTRWRSVTPERIAILLSEDLAAPLLVDEKAVVHERPSRWASIKTDLRWPAGVRIVDSCGGKGALRGGEVVLVSECRMDLDAFVILGGTGLRYSESDPHSTETDAGVLSEASLRELEGGRVSGRTLSVRLPSAPLAGPWEPADPDREFAGLHGHLFVTREGELARARPPAPRPGTMKRRTLTDDSRNGQGALP
jgi:ABC-2 family transporter protein